MKRIINFILPLAVITGSIFLDLMLIQGNNFHFILIPIECIVLFLILYFNFQIIDFNQEYISITRILRPKKRIRYSLIKELKVTHFVNERKNGNTIGYRFEIILQQDEYFLKISYDETYKNQLVKFFKEKNVKIKFVESPFNKYEDK